MTTPLMTRILFATDFSDDAACAQDAMYRICHSSGKGLGADGTLMYVLEAVCYDLDCGLGVIGTKYENGTIGTGS